LATFTVVSLDHEGQWLIRSTTLPCLKTATPILLYIRLELCACPSQSNHSLWPKRRSWLHSFRAHHLSNDGLTSETINAKPHFFSHFLFVLRFSPTTPFPDFNFNHKTITNKLPPNSPRRRSSSRSESRPVWTIRTQHSRTSLQGAHGFPNTFEWIWARGRMGKQDWEEHAALIFGVCAVWLDRRELYTYGWGG